MCANVRLTRLSLVPHVIEAARFSVKYRPVSGFFFFSCSHAVVVIPLLFCHHCNRFLGYSISQRHCFGWTEAGWGEVAWPMTSIYSTVYSTQTWSRTKVLWYVYILYFSAQLVCVLLTPPLAIVYVDSGGWPSGAPGRFPVAWPPTWPARRLTRFATKGLDRIALVVCVCFYFYF